MKKTITTAMLALFLCSVLSAQLAQDNASNYGSGWTTGSNGGSGFSGWNLTTQNTGVGNFAGHFLGSSTGTHGDVNTGGQAFGMFGNPTGSNPQANAFRDFNYMSGGNTFTELQDGHTFSIELAVNFRNGYKGIDLLASDNSILYNFNVEDDNYKVNGSNLSWAYDASSVVVLEVTQANANDLYIRLTRGSDMFGINIYGTGGKRISGFKTYVGNTGGSSENNLFFNNLEIRNTAPLPVVFQAIKVQTQKHGHQVSWQTVGELNNDYFELQRSTDSKVWAKIAQQAGAGTTQQTQYYEAMDAAPQVGQNYYRVKQVDYDGAFSYSEIVASVWQEGISVQLSPNPTSAYLQISGLEQVEDVVEVRLYNLAGQLMIEEEYQGEAIQLNGLPSGQYQLQVVGYGAVLATQMVLVQ